MAYVKIWIHAAWGTKNHQPILNREIRPVLFSHIRENARKKGIYIDYINGWLDHVHCLLALNADMSMAKVMQLIKGESAYWTNKRKLVHPKLAWADEYYAGSIAESMRNQVRDYIANQETHHKKKTYIQECEEFLKSYNFIVTAKAGN